MKVINYFSTKSQIKAYHLKPQFYPIDLFINCPSSIIFATFSFAMRRSLNSLSF